MKAYLRLFFSPYGRINRRVFIHAWLILACAYFGLVYESFAFLYPPTALLGWALTLYPSTCVYTHRLHDIGRSGWWQAYPRAGTGMLLTMSYLSIKGPHGSVVPGPWRDRFFENIPGAGGMALLAVAAIGMLAEIGLFFWLTVAPGEAVPTDTPE